MEGGSGAAGDAPAPEGLDIRSLRLRNFGKYEHDYSERDVVLYALGLGCSPAGELLRFVYEGHPNFAALPTFPIIAAHPSLKLVPLESIIPGGVDRTKALHGEQFLQLVGPMPLSGRLVTRPQLLDVQDKGKGKGCVVVMRTETCDELTGQLVAINEFVTFILGTGGFGGRWPPAPRPAAAVAANDPPSRPPDAVECFRTTPDQAALYRLSGDYNPLHIDPQVAQRVGFQRPILHGLCSMGVAVRLVLQRFAAGDPARLATAKVRFSKPVLPGETLRVEMWDVGGGKIVFRAAVEERPGVLAITHAAVELRGGACLGGQSQGQPPNANQAQSTSQAQVQPASQPASKM